MPAGPGLAGADIGRHAGELWGRELSLRFLAHAEWQLGRHNEAEAALVECLHIDRQLGDLWHMAWSTEALGWVAVDTGRFERGARLLGIAAGLWAQPGRGWPTPGRPGTRRRWSTSASAWVPRA